MESTMDDKRDNFIETWPSRTKDVVQSQYQQSGELSLRIVTEVDNIWLVVVAVIGPRKKITEKIAFIDRNEQYPQLYFDIKERGDGYIIERVVLRNRIKPLKDFVAEAKKHMQAILAYIKANPQAVGTSLRAALKEDKGFPFLRGGGFNPR